MEGAAQPLGDSLLARTTHLTGVKWWGDHGPEQCVC